MDDQLLKMVLFLNLDLYQAFFSIIHKLQNIKYIHLRNQDLYNLFNLIYCPFSILFQYFMVNFAIERKLSKQPLITCMQNLQNIKNNS